MEPGGQHRPGDAGHPSSVRCVQDADHQGANSSSVSSRARAGRGRPSRRCTGRSGHQGGATCGEAAGRSRRGAECDHGRATDARRGRVGVEVEGASTETAAAQSGRARTPIAAAGHGCVEDPAAAGVDATPVRRPAERGRPRRARVHGRRDGGERPGPGRREKQGFFGVNVLRRGGHQQSAFCRLGGAAAAANCPPDHPLLVADTQGRWSTEHRQGGAGGFWTRRQETYAASCGTGGGPRRPGPATRASSTPWGPGTRVVGGGGPGSHGETGSPWRPRAGGVPRPGSDGSA